MPRMKYEERKRHAFLCQVSSSLNFSHSCRRSLCSCKLIKVFKGGNDSRRTQSRLMSESVLELYLLSHVYEVNHFPRENERKYITFSLIEAMNFKIFQMPCGSGRPIREQHLLVQSRRVSTMHYYS